MMDHRMLRHYTDIVSAHVSAGFDVQSAMINCKVPEYMRDDVEARVERIRREGRPRDYMTPTERFLLKEQ